MAKNKTDQENRRASNVLTAFNIMFLLASFAIIGSMIYIQYFWHPPFEEYFRPQKSRHEIAPERGSILDHNGELLAMSTPRYDIYMDCKMMKDAYAEHKNKKKGAELEQKWIDSAKVLATMLPKVLVGQKKTAYDYDTLIVNSRAREKKGRYVPIVKDIDHSTLLQLKQLPLYNEKISYRNCLIVEKRMTRQYPFDQLAKISIGHVRHYKDSARTTTYVGIEGKYNHILQGKSGLEWKRITDKKVLITDVDSTVTEAVNGADIRTTLDMNIQDIADRALRKNMAKEENIVAGCVIILDTETAGVRAIVNLKKDDDGDFRESENRAVGMASEPGSVFKAAILTALLEDGYVTLRKEIPSNHGIMADMPRLRQDTYVLDYERESHRNMISVLEGFKRSSNYVFRRHVKDNYEDRPEELINKLYSYQFGSGFQFDLKDRGHGTPSLPDPGSKGWNPTDLIATAIGYAVKTTPMQTACFYNAIANDGKMLKPYIVESYESGGEVLQKFEPVILNGAICTKATADSVTRALIEVTTTGTARRLRFAKSQIAGKTGTSRIHLDKEDNPKPKDKYTSMDGRKKHQATFVGFFPADQPKYTAIVVVYTRLIDKDVYGGAIPAQTFMEIADELWAYDNEKWGKGLEAAEEIPDMKAGEIIISKAADSPVPDLTGMGLCDALYAIENNGYRCRYSGSGHVTVQTPEPGSMLTKGQTINIVLE